MIAHEQVKSQVVKPNFFIVGAVKSGTTSMYNYLREHPQVFMPDEKLPGIARKNLKEPYFFGRDLEMAEGWAVRDLDVYLSLFAGAGDAKRVGEASVWSLVSETAAREIKEFNPESLIIIMLRNPVDVMYSLHGQHLYSGTEDIEDFAIALAAEDDRREGRRIPRTAPFPRGLQYRSVAQFSEQVKRYFDVFGHEAVHVILFDDFVSDTERQFHSTLEFLGLDTRFRPNFEPKNQSSSKNHRNLTVRRFLKTRPKIKRILGDYVPLRMRRRIGDGLAKILHQHHRPSKLDPQLRKRLIEEFTPEVKRLGELLDRDLTHWCATG